MNSPESQHHEPERELRILTPEHKFPTFSEEDLPSPEDATSTLMHYQLLAGSLSTLTLWTEMLSWVIITHLLTGLGFCETHLSTVGVQVCRAHQKNTRAT